MKMSAHVCVLLIIDVILISESTRYGERCSVGGCHHFRQLCVRGPDRCMCETGYSYTGTSCTRKPAPTSGLAPNTSLMQPTAEIHFYKAEGRADSYKITLKRDDYNIDKRVSGYRDILSASFPGVSAGLFYNLTIITNSFGLSSLPFRKTIRIRTEAPESVVDLSVYNIKSRVVSLSWKRPINTGGTLYKYTTEVFSSSMCVQRINIQCTACLRSMNVTNSVATSCESETDTVIIRSDLNDLNFLVQHDLSLLPATAYDVVVAAYNEEGKGQIDEKSVVTKEEAPTAVENLEHQPVDGVYNQYQLSWTCPPQKDGRNGDIRSATVITSSFTKFVDIDPATGEHYFDNADCTWREKVTVTPECNYTFEVFISNSHKGKSTTFKRYMPAGPPSLVNSDQPIIKILRERETEKSVEILICPTCLLDNTNGVVVNSGILVCAKGNCPIRNFDEMKTAEYFDKSPNWDATTGVGFSTWYRATEDDWLKGKEASGEIRFVLGEESCGVQDQNRFCNGPLPVDRTYRVWLFACTRAACSEGNHVEFTLDDSLPLPIIGAIVGGGVLLVLAVVLLVLYIKVIRPRSQRQKSIQHTHDTSTEMDIYDEGGMENRLSVIQDVRPEVDYYNTKDSPPHSENLYDRPAVYNNVEQNGYGRIKVTQA